MAISMDDSDNDNYAPTAWGQRTSHHTTVSLTSRPVISIIVISQARTTQTTVRQLCPWTVSKNLRRISLLS